MAATLADRAVAMAEANSQARELLARCLRRRSGLALQMRRLEAAASDAARAVAIETERADPGRRSCHVGLAYLALGRALSARGQSGEATAALASALQHLEPTLGEDHPETRSARRLLNGQ
jgi:hypothetical protein